ncbi:hypothetical protein [Sandaracinus amylolyticus]|uniref:hypothetical protein n=1 Tax=Sandaracinus amylolyticus TaxID=927083 RepID=UPI001F383C28|nr:hypothetical protein [Sandaracinus amylolyticus]UJR79949.1 Hypothetical protein I5071_19890 [Sandaracinus amylolyticus]
MRAAWIACVVMMAAASGIAGCGGGLESAHADPTEHEDDAMLARQWHERVVRLESEANVAAQREEACAPRCEIAAHACDLSGRICELAGHDDHDEGTRMLCEDARPRCDRARAAAGACGCQS